jgi:AraC-like DNA-binding protein
MRPIIRWTALPDCRLGRVTLAGRIPDSVGLPGDGSRLRRWPTRGIIYLLAGSVLYRDRLERRRILGAGDLLLIVPEVPHHFAPHRCPSFHEVFVSFEGPVFDTLERAGVLDPQRPFHHLRPLSRWARRIAAFHQDQPCTEADAVVAIGRLVQLLTDISAAREGAVVDSESAWLATARQALLATGLRHADRQAAARLGLGVVAFRRRFTRLAGTPPGRYRLREALQAAAGLLADSDLGLAAIAEQVGFSEVQTFARRFRAVMGQPPALFRRQSRG